MNDSKEKENLKPMVIQMLGNKTVVLNIIFGFIVRM